MKKTYALITAASLALSAPFVLAADMNHDAMMQKHQTMMQSHKQTMQAQMDEIQKTKDSKKRHELMSAHMASMMGMMQMMQQPRSDMGGDRVKMLENRVDALQELLNNILRHQHQQSVQEGIISEADMDAG